MNALRLFLLSPRGIALLRWTAPRLVAGLTLVTLGWGFANVHAADSVAADDKPQDSRVPSAKPDQINGKNPMPDTKHYENAEWNFAIDIPKHWKQLAPVYSNSPYEVVRFESDENSTHNLIIIFRSPKDPKESLTEWADKIRQILGEGGFDHFVTGKTTIGSRPASTLDFDKPEKDGKIWSVRYYFIADGTLGYILGFGGSGQPALIVDSYDRMAKSFQIIEPPTGRK